MFPALMARFPRVRFYDYTKDAGRVRAWIRGELPTNYHLTYSLSEAEGSEANAREFLAAGVNVAVVFRTAEFPKTFLGARVRSGDGNDLRFLDPRKGLVIGLKAKGRAKKDRTGFVRNVA
jgi:hypothetical protein